MPQALLSDCEVTDSDYEGSKTMSATTMRQGGQELCGDEFREPLVIARFEHEEQAAEAIEDLRERWKSSESSFMGENISTREAAIGMLKGIAIAGPIGSLATLGLLDLLTDLWGYGHGSMSLAWMLSGLIIGAFLGVVIGAFAGLYQTVRANEGRLREIPLGEEDTLVVAVAGSDAGEAREIMVQHEGCHVTEI